MPRSVILWVLGAPGVGKTTLVRGLLNHPWYPRPVVTAAPDPKWTLAPDGNGGYRMTTAGHYTGEMFDGADTVPYNGARKALEWWAGGNLRDVALTVFDGQRFATEPSLDFIRAAAPEHTLVAVYLHASDIALAVRRAGRGSDQSASWMKGATTRARNFADKMHMIVGAQAHVVHAHDVRLSNATKVHGNTLATVLKIIEAAGAG